MDDKYTPNLFDRIVCAIRSTWYLFADRIRRLVGRVGWYDNGHITILIPSRNRKAILQARALSSLYRQSYHDFRVIVINDGGEDLSDQESRFVFVVDYYPKVFHYPNTAWGRWCAGPVRAMNFARQFIPRQGWVLRIDDDDELTPTALEDLLDFARETGAELVSARHTAMGKAVTPYKIGGHVVGGIQTTLCRTYIAKIPYNPDCWRKSWDCMNDIDWVKRVIATGARTYYLPKVVCMIRPRPGQTEIGWRAQKAEYRGGE